MPFSVPDFNLVVGIYTGPWATKVFRQFQDCNLAFGRRTQTIIGGGTGSGLFFGMVANLLLPAGTDVRDNGNASGYDCLEIPPGSGRWYQANCVDDVGKGFPNEYRLVTLGKICQAADAIEFAGVFWPTPIP